MVDVRATTDAENWRWEQETFDPSLNHRLIDEWMTIRLSKPVAATCPSKWDSSTWVKPALVRLLEWQLDQELECLEPRVSVRYSFQSAVSSKNFSARSYLINGLPQQHCATTRTNYRKAVCACYGQRFRIPSCKRAHTSAPFIKRALRTD